MKLRNLWWRIKHRIKKKVGLTKREYKWLGDEFNDELDHS